ncbi:MAG TPA: MG2 domain-containing protein, partial [Spirochaetia bacterium]|nr:MG2 domain-containing protein [Spirochaetia bacterium]
MSPSLKSLQGEAITGDTTFTFRTEPLSIVSMSPSGDDVEPEASQQVLLTFNFPVDMKTILPSLRLEAAGKSVPFKAGRPEITNREQLGPYEDADRMVLLTPSSALPWDTDVKVRVLKGARPRPENYGTDAEIAQSFHTLRPLSVEDTSSVMGRTGVTAQIRFNHAIKEETAAPNLRMASPGYDVAKNLDISGQWVSLANIPSDFESSFSVDVLAGITDQYGQKLGEDQTETFDVGPAEAYVNFRDSGQRILEAQFPPNVAVEMQNVDSGSYAVGRLSSPFASLPAGRQRTIDTSGIPRNRRHFELFNLLPYLNDAGKGAAYLSWTFKGLFEGSDTPEEQKESLVVQVTDIGASLHVGFNSVMVMASSLATGAPISGATATLRKDGKAVASARTDAKGLAAIPLAPGVLAGAFGGEEEKAEIEIVNGKDRLVLRPSEMQGRTWNADQPYAAEKATPLTYVWSDRGIYRPGETISFAGIDRDLALGKLGTVPGRFRVDLTNGGDDSEPAASANGGVSPSGSFSGQLVLPKDAVPGDWLLTFHRLAGRSDTKTGTAYVQVANFRRVAFSVALSVPDTRVYMGDTLAAKLSGSYLSGGNVTRGKWSWFWTRRETWYQPPGDALAEYTFGDVEKGWAEDLGSDSGSLNGTAEITATQKLGDGEPGRVYDYEVSGTIEDVDRQAISQTTDAQVFSSEQMLGAKLTSDPKSEDSLYFVTKGQPFTLKVVSVDPDGSPYKSGPVQGRLVRDEWKLVRELTVGQTVDTHYEKQEVEEKTFTVQPGRPFAAVSLATQKAGSYAIELSGKDARGRESFTRFTFYATGSDEILWQRSDERQLEIVPDKKIYSPGDTAKLLIKSPVSGGTYLVSVERDGVLQQRVVNLPGTASTLSIPITEDYVPIVYVYVATATGRTQPPADGPDAPDFGKPRGYSGLLEIPVQTGSRTITLSLTSAKPSYLPGTDATVTLKATKNGQPLPGAEIALVAADRGVLDLINYHLPSPIDFFYNRSSYLDKVAHFDSRDLLMDPVTWKANDLPGGDEKGESAPAAPGVSVRKDFNPTAVFRTGLITGRDGTVSVRFKLPDLLTTFRSTAVAVKDDSFGIAEGEILVQNPINVRTALPRRMRVGDAATAGVVLTNIDARPHAVTVGLSAQGLQVTGDAKKTVTLKAGDTAEVAFNLATPTEGTARLAFSIDSDVLRERLEDNLAISDPHLTESVTIVGKTGDQAREALVVPSSFLGVPEEGLYLSL